MCAQTEENEAVLVGGVIGIVEEQGALVVENGRCFLESNTMLAAVDGVLGRVPPEAQLRHDYSVHTLGGWYNDL